MEKIKFRGKRVETGEWVYGYYFEPHLIPAIQVFTATGRNYKVFEVISKTIAQYIGFKDEDVQEIYTDHIIKFVSNRWRNIDCKIDVVGVVVWDVCGFSLQTGKYNFLNLADAYSHAYSDNFLNGVQLIGAKILGNVHDNPDLINLKE